MTAPTIHDPVGPVEIQERLGVTRSRYKKWRDRDDFPEPEATVGGFTPVWSWAAIAAWWETFPGRTWGTSGD